MKRPNLRVRRRWRAALGVVLLPPALWAALLLAVPTECSRRTVARRLSAATGRVVTLGALRLGPLGGVRLDDLRIGTPGSGADPWLYVRSAAIDVSLVQLLFGRFEPTSVEVEGAELRVLRRADGTLELGDFLGPARTGADPADTPEARRRGAVRLGVRRSSITLIDVPTASRVRFRGVEGRAECDGVRTSLTELHGLVNGGPFQVALVVDRSGPRPTFEGRLRARDVALDEGFAALDYLLPVLAGGPEFRVRADGRLALDFYWEGEGDTREALRRSLAGSGRLDLDPVALDGSRLLAELGDLAHLPKRGRVGSVGADLAVRGGRIASENLTVTLGRVPVVLAGWTDFDGRVDYRLRTEGLAGQWKEQARGYLAGFGLGLDRGADVRVVGTVDHPSVLVDGVPLAAGPTRSGLERAAGRKGAERVRR